MDANKLENIISGYSISADDAAWLRALAQQPAAAVPEGFDALRQFAEWVIGEAWQGRDIGGGDAQDKAHDLGLIDEVTVTEPCNDMCNCGDGGFPTTCYRLGPVLAARRAREGGCVMDTCTYDNPDTMRRELWCKGSILLSVCADLISQKDAHLSTRDWPFTTRAFNPGHIEGNPEALAERAKGAGNE